MGSIGSNVDTAVSKIESQLELFATKLKELLAKAEVATAETKVESRKRLDELKGKLTVARAKLDEAKAAGGDKWTSFKLGLESSAKELEEAFNKLTH